MAITFCKKKKIILVQDNDDAGELGREELVKQISSVTEVAWIQWPKDFPVKGDITDFFTEYKGTADEYRKLLAQSITPKQFSKDTKFKHENVAQQHLADSTNPTNTGKRFKTLALVGGKTDSPYLVPKAVTFSCGDAADPEQKKCQGCACCKAGGLLVGNIGATESIMLSLLNTTDLAKKYCLLEHFNINTRCKIVEQIDVVNRKVDELVLHPKVDEMAMVAREGEYVTRKAYVVDNDVQANKKYTFYGTLTNCPKTQEAVLLFDKAIPEKDVIKNFEINEDVKKSLDIFKVGDKTVEDKIYAMHNDLERNVTHVWERREIAIAVDLVYNSVLSFYFQNKFIKRGWTELLIIGDSGQAKSETVSSLMRHYKLGELLSGEATKRTGLLYSQKQIGTKWMISWGALPLNDGGLLAIDELSGMSDDELSKLSEVRTSGVAKVAGVTSGETNARTRLIYISNPRNGKQLKSEAFGVEAILKLFGKAEDVRRLDIAVGASAADIDPSIINIPIDERPKVKHVCTSEACNARVRWAWSRTAEQIKFSADAIKLILVEATKMGKAYSSRIPLIEAADQRIKLARLATACAAMVVSTDETYENVLVTKEHVEFVVKFLNKIYSMPSLNYMRYSRQDNDNNDDSKQTINKLRIKYAQLPVSDLNELTSTLYTLGYLTKNTLSDYTGLMPTDLLAVVKFLTTNKLVETAKFGQYRRTPLGTTFFEYMEANPITKSEIAQIRTNTNIGGEY